MYDSLLVGRFYARAHCRHDLQRALWRKTSFFSQNILQRLAFNEIHHQIRHFVGDAEVRDVNNISMADARGQHCFLTEARQKHRIITHQVRQDHLDSVGSFEEDMTGLEDNPHAALAETPLELITAVEHSIASDGKG